MKTLYVTSLCVALLGCADKQRAFEGNVAPFKAVVAFSWSDSTSPRGAEVPAPGGDMSAAGSPGGATEREEPSAGGLTRSVVEDAILAGFREHQVFSEIMRAEDSDEGELQRVAEREEADLMVRVVVDSLGQSQGQESRSVELGTLDVVLWLGTGVLSWWVPDVSYGTHSEIFLEFKTVEGKRWVREKLSSSAHGLALWDRAKPWRYPQAYLLSIVIPPVWLPIEDAREVDRSLALRAIEDIKRDLAMTLRGGSLGDIGAPFRFALENPPNGAATSSRTVNLQFKYRSSTAETEDVIPLGSLRITARAADGTLVFEKQLSQKELDLINTQIKDKGEQVVSQEVAIGPGVNLIRFVGKTEILDRWVRNTVKVTGQ